MALSNTELKVSSIVVTIIISAILLGVSVFLLGEYGALVFLLVPFLMGFIPSIVLAKNGEAKFKDGMLVGTYTFLVVTFGMLIIAFEGLICIAMSIPIVFPFMIFGAGAAVWMMRWRKNRSIKENLLILCLLGALSFGFDYQEKELALMPVKTSIKIEANIEDVWTNVVTFSNLPEPTDWIFKTGLAYPMNATIEGEGVGAVRYCNFSTGPFVEPITIWNQPNLLAFDVKSQPIPMNEMNPFREVHPPHLEGYFVSKKGQFALTKIDEKQTLLEGTTWYYLDIHPAPYWSAWSDFIIHRIHLQVLNHIKVESEE